MQGSWKQQIQRKFKNLRAPPKTANQKRLREEDEENEQLEPPLNTPSKQKSQCKDIEVTSEQEGYDAKIDFLQEESTKEKPSKSKLSDAMESTFAKRRQWIHDENPSVADILDKFRP